jgi:histidine kinase/DNA gyrase B/HSP90-like ATPase
MNEKQTLKDWLCKKENNWGLQVIVDALAIGEGLPLRIICYDSLKNLYRSIVEQFQPTSELQSNTFVSSYSNKAEWDHYVTEIINWATLPEDIKTKGKKRPNLSTLTELIRIYPILATNIFPVLPANQFPMEMLSRISFNEHRVFCLLWFYHWIIINNQIPSEANKPATCNGGALSFPTMSMASQWIKNDALVLPSDGKQKNHQNWLMIIGPCFGGSVSMFSEAAYDKKIIKPTIEFIEHFSQGISREKLFHRHRFRRAAHETMPLPWKELELRQERVNAAFTLLLAFDINALGDTLTRHDLYHLTLWSLFSSSRAKNIVEILKRHACSLIFHYGDDYEPEKEHARAHSRTCFTVEQSTDNCLQLSVRNESTVPRLSSDEIIRQVDQYGFVLQFDNLELNQKVLDQLRTQYCRFYLRAYRKNRSLDGVRLMIISDRLHRELGSNSKDSFREICQWLSGLLRSESIVLYRLDPQERNFGKFIGIDYFSRLPSNEIHLKALIKDIEDIKTEEDIKKSITYRAVMENTAQVCLMYDPENQVEVPEGSTLYHSKDSNNLTLRSAIAVPIRFNGRRQGAIEVNAYKPWQFSWGQQLVLEQAASVIGPYFYNKRFSEALSNINKKVLEFDHEGLTESELYPEICIDLANIFLCNGASFWVRKINEGHILVQKGIHNITLETNEIDLHQYKLIANKLSKQPDSKKPFFSFSLDEMEKNTKWIKGLNEQNIKNISLLPLFEKETGQNKLLAIVILYTRDKIGFKDSWNGIMNYMSGFLPFVVEAINAFVHGRNTVANVVQHEIWHDAAYLANKAAEIARQRSDLRKRLLRLTKVVQSSRFIKCLDESIILEGWRREDIESVKGLQHAVDATLFLPQEDMQYFAETLKTRIDALFNNKKYLNKESKKLLSEIGDRSIVDLITVDEQEKTINLKLISNRLTEKHPEIKKKGLYLYNYNLPSIIARQTAVDTVLRNLLDNAIKYSANNSAITIDAEEQRSGSIKLIIENEGWTMIDLNECFDVLQKGIRGSNAKRVKTGEKDVPGLGMGLYIVQMLCKHVLRFDFTFRAQELELRPEVRYIATLHIPANRVVRR